MAQRSGNTAEAVLEGANFAARGKNVADGLKNAEIIANELAQVGKQIRREKRLMGAVGLITETFGESRMESLNGVDEIYGPYIQKAEEARRKAIQSTEDFMAEDDMSNSDDEKWFQYIQTVGIDGQVQYNRVLTERGKAEYQKRISQIEDSYDKTMQNLAYEAAGAGNRIFAANVVFLSMTNWLQMGKWYTGGYEANVWNGRKIVQEIAGKDGATKFVRNKAITRGMVTQTILDNVIESFEEGGQGVITKTEGVYSKSNISKNMIDLALDHNFAQQLDFETNTDVVNLVQSFA
mgnify:CR=1 FL=1